MRSYVGLMSQVVAKGEGVHSGAEKNVQRFNRAVNNGFDGHWSVCSTSMAR